MRALRTIMTIFIILFILVGVSAQAAVPVGALARFATSHGTSAATSAANVTTAATKTRVYSQLELATLPQKEPRQLHWTLQNEYSGNTFFNGFQFFSQPDPSNGMVNYVDHDTAFRTGLAFWTQDGVPGIQAEHWKTLAVGDKRDSVRISSTALYGGGLFVLDMKLVPWGCAVWPAVWLLGYESAWPYAGEIDIIEGVQESTRNQMTVHTAPGCTISPDGAYTGTLLDADCDSTGSGSRGCAILSNSAMSYGKDFNAGGGGVFATLWDGAGIKIWNWARADVPWDVTAGTPSPATWGTPVAAFLANTCDPYVFFKPATLILNVNLCGDWAGSTYANSCPGICAERIANPANLGETVMLINSIKIYQLSGSPMTFATAAATNNLTGVGGHVSRVGHPGAKNAGEHVKWHLGAVIAAAVLVLVIVCG